MTKKVRQVGETVRQSYRFRLGGVVRVEWRDSADMVRVIMPQGMKPRYMLVRASQIDKMITEGDLIPQEVQE